MKAFTDYPINSNLDGNVIEVDVLSYDRNKYVTIKYQDQEYEVKRGYIFKDAALMYRFNENAFYILPYESTGDNRTRKQAHAEVMSENRQSKTEYVVWVGVVPNARIVYSSLDAAMKAIVDKFYDNVYVCLVKCQKKKCSVTSAPLFEINKGIMTIYTDRNGHPDFKASHREKYHIAVKG